VRLAGLSARRNPTCVPEALLQEPEELTLVMPLVPAPRRPADAADVQPAERCHPCGSFATLHPPVFGTTSGRSRPLHPPPLAGCRRCWLATRSSMRRCRSRSVRGVSSHSPARVQPTFHPPPVSVVASMSTSSGDMLRRGCLAWCRIGTEAPPSSKFSASIVPGRITAVPRYGTTRSAVSAQSRNARRLRRSRRATATCVGCAGSS